MGSVMMVRKGNNHRDRRKKELNVAKNWMDCILGKWDGW